MGRKFSYWAIAGVFLVSLAALYFSWKDDLLKILAAIPFFGSLVGMLVKVLLDQAAYERSLLIQNAQNNFVLGAGSRMGNATFDKYVEFSEAYVKEAFSALETLTSKGPTEEILEHAAMLYKLRRSYVLWLTDDLEGSLNDFESALRRIGANAYLVEALRTSADRQETRSQALKEMFNTFAQVMGFKEWDGATLTDELAINALARRLRAILGTEELTKLRLSILESSKKIAQ